jgi:hypothetical protein
MKLFGRKDEGNPEARSSRAGADGDSAACHRLTADLTRAEKLAAMIAHSRASVVIEVADLLAGMYIGDWDRLSRYWREEDQEEIEDFLRNICRISPQRWHSWIEFYDLERRKEGKRRTWSFLRPRRNGEKSLPHSAALALLFKRAEEISPFRDTVDGRDIPILTCECVLLCMVQSYGTEISRKLASAGLDNARLEREALHPRRGPTT